MKTVYIVITTVLILAGMAQPTRAGPDPAAQPVTTPSTITSIPDAVRAIQQAQQPSPAVAAYSAGTKLDPDNIALNTAYVQRMVDLEVPQVAYMAAQHLTGVDPQNGLAWAVLAYTDAQHGNMLSALINIVLAADRLRDHPFVLRTTGQLFAWYDKAPKQPALPDSVKASITTLKQALADKKPYTDAYQQALGFYDKQAQNPTAETTPPADTNTTAAPPDSSATPPEVAPAYPPDNSVVYGEPPYTVNNYYYETPGYMYGDYGLDYYPYYGGFSYFGSPYWYGFGGFGLNCIFLGFSDHDDVCFFHHHHGHDFDDFHHGFGGDQHHNGDFHGHSGDAFGHHGDSGHGEHALGSSHSGAHTSTSPAAHPEGNNSSPRFFPSSGHGSSGGGHNGGHGGHASLGANSAPRSYAGSYTHAYGGGYAPSRSGFSGSSSRGSAGSFHGGGGGSFHSGGGHMSSGFAGGGFHGGGGGGGHHGR